MQFMYSDTDSHQAHMHMFAVQTYEEWEEPHGVMYVVHFVAVNHIILHHIDFAHHCC